jgi:hypothetical protein
MPRKGQPSAAARASEHYFATLERATTLDEAWRIVLSAPRAPAVGVERYTRLAHFLKHLEPAPTSTHDELRAYLALVRRFLKTSSMDPPVALRAIAVLMDAEKALAATKRG